MRREGASVGLAVREWGLSPVGMGACLPEVRSVNCRSVRDGEEEKECAVLDGYRAVMAAGDGVSSGVCWMSHIYRQAHIRFLMRD